MQTELEFLEDLLACVCEALEKGNYAVALKAMQDELSERITELDPELT